MKKLFVPYELALALKEKGFDEPCITKFEQYFDKTKLQAVISTLSLNAPYEYEYNGYDQVIINSELHYHFTGYKNSVKDHNQNILAAPLYQQVIDWFREKHEVDFFLFKLKKDIYKFDVHQNGERKTLPNPTRLPYYEALDKAIEEGLKLI